MKIGVTWSKLRKVDDNKLAHETRANNAKGSEIVERDREREDQWKDGREEVEEKERQGRERKKVRKIEH